MNATRPFTTAGGRITVVCGPMFSGKTDKLLQHANKMAYAKVPIAVFKHQSDARAADGLVNARDGRSFKAHVVDSSSDIPKIVRATKAKAVYIDEAQFFDNDLVNVCLSLAKSGKEVLCAGLDTDFAGRPFGPMAGLMSIADAVEKRAAVCTVCGRRANMSQRLVGGQPASPDSGVVQIGDKETYEARCRKHHVVPSADGSAKKKGRTANQKGSKSVYSL